MVSITRNLSSFPSVLSGRWREGRGVSSLALLGVVLALITVTPLLGVLKIALTGEFADWPHIAKFVLPNTLQSTFSVLLITLFLTAILGVGSAWLVSFCNFRFRGLLSVLLVLPFAVPTFVSAYYWVEFLSFSGPVQSSLRAVFGWTSLADYWFPSLNNVWGLSFIYASVLYPYVYMTVRILFVTQSCRLVECGRVLGAKGGEIFWRITLPLARPAIAVGLALVAMEALNDIGAAEYLGVNMLALSVLHTWLNRASLPGAAQLALLILALVMFFLWVETKSRRSPSLSIKTTRRKMEAPYNLGSFHSALAIAFCMLPIVIGFLIPFMSIIVETLKNLGVVSLEPILEALWNSTIVSTGAALICLTIAVVLVGSARHSNAKIIRGFMRLATLGYAIPGTVLGLGTLVILAGFDNWLDAIMQRFFGLSTGLLLTGTVFGLIFVCSVRFIAVAHGALSAQVKRIGKDVDNAARCLGHNGWSVFVRLYVPILAKAGLAGALLVFVDTLKELSASIVLLPPEFLTLSTYLYQKASNAQVDEGGIAALIIITVGLIPVIFVQRQLDAGSNLIMRK